MAGKLGQHRKIKVFWFFSSEKNALSYFPYPTSIVPNLQVAGIDLFSGSVKIRKRSARGYAMRLTPAMLCLVSGTLAGLGSAAAALPFGPDTCMNGYVWREAYPNDHVCVLPRIRAQAQADNAAAASNVQPGGGPYGPGTCKQGLVWREARPSDHVCVAPGNRDQAKTDNLFAYSRQQAHAGKPVARAAGGGTHAVKGNGDDGTSGGTQIVGQEGAQVCAERFLCPPEMKMAVDTGGTCVCGRQ